MDKKNLIKEITRILNKNIPKNFKFFLFGSWAKGNALPTSDLDIAILGPTKVPAKVLLSIKEQIDNLPTLRQIDIVDLNSVDESFKENVLQSAKIL